MSTYTPSEQDLQFAREVLAGAPSGDDYEIHYLVGMLRSQLGMTENFSRDDVPAEQMVRNCRAAILAYDERRNR